MAGIDPSNSQRLWQVEVNIYQANQPGFTDTNLNKVRFRNILLTFVKWVIFS